MCKQRAHTSPKATYVYIDTNITYNLQQVTAATSLACRWNSLNITRPSGTCRWPTAVKIPANKNCRRHQSCRSIYQVSLLDWRLPYRRLRGSLEHAKPVWRCKLVAHFNKLRLTKLHSFISWAKKVMFLSLCVCLCYCGNSNGCGRICDELSGLDFGGDTNHNVDTGISKFYWLVPESSCAVIAEVFCLRVLLF